MTVRSVQKRIFSFMESVNNIKEDVFGKDALELLDLKKKKRQADLEITKHLNSNDERNENTEELLQDNKDAILEEIQ